MPHLRATYSSSAADASSLHEFDTTLPAPHSDMSTDERIAFLEKLRESVVQLQDDINLFLTDKMEQDKANAGPTPGKPGVDDAKEEENYGEEVVEEE